MTTPVRAAILVGFEVAEVGFEQHGLEQLVDAVAGARGDGDHFGLAAPLDGLQALFGELRFDAIGLRVFLVHLVDRDDDRHVRGFDVRLIASIVCGMTPSSAATTRIATSVTFAPRARIAVNAS